MADNRARDLHFYWSSILYVTDISPASLFFSTMNSRMMDVQRATENFHMQLHALLHHQGLIQVMQHSLPSNPEMLFQEQEIFMNRHAEFAQAHQRLLEAYRDLFVWEANLRPPYVVPETPEIRMPRVVRRSSAARAVGYTTPPRPRAQRALFPQDIDALDLTCSETL